MNRSGSGETRSISGETGAPGFREGSVRVSTGGSNGGCHDSRPDKARRPSIWVGILIPSGHTKEDCPSRHGSWILVYGMTTDHVSSVYAPYSSISYTCRVLPSLPSVAHTSLAKAFGSGRFMFEGGRGWRSMGVRLARKRAKVHCFQRRTAHIHQDMPCANMPEPSSSVDFMDNKGFSL